MKITVRLFADQARYRPGYDGPFTMELPDGSPVDALLTALGAADDPDVIVAIGERLARRDTVLHDQDAVELIARMTGGRD